MDRLNDTQIAEMNAIADCLSHDLDTLLVDQDFWQECVMEAMSENDYLRAHFELTKLCALRNLEEQIASIRRMFPKLELIKGNKPTKKGKLNGKSEEDTATSLN